MEQPRPADLRDLGHPRVAGEPGQVGLGHGIRRREPGVVRIHLNHLQAVLRELRGRRAGGLLGRLSQEGARRTPHREHDDEENHHGDDHLDQRETAAVRHQNPLIQPLL
jgi:hypothetical protein